MSMFVLAITTYNRKDYLQSCIDSWFSTKNTSNKWTLIVADDGSNDGTIEYLESLRLEATEVFLIKNKRIGVHQQMNSIIKKLENIDFDFCFKIDDDITFFKTGWDNLYYQEAIKTGNHHLVFCDRSWCSEQLLQMPIKNNKLIGRVSALNVHGFFYTLTKDIIESVGYMDTDSFGFRGMGHVDYTIRCAKAGFTDIKTPWDIDSSNDYITATKTTYKSVLSSDAINIYDSFVRKNKEKIISTKERVFIDYKQIDTELYNKFQDHQSEAFISKITDLEKEKKSIIVWYDDEIKKIKSWYSNRYNHLPKWYLKIGEIFKKIKNKNE